MNFTTFVLLYGITNRLFSSLLLVATRGITPIFSVSTNSNIKFLTRRGVFNNWFHQYLLHHYMPVSANWWDLVILSKQYAVIISDYMIHIKKPLSHTSEPSYILTIIRILNKLNTQISRANSSFPCQLLTQILEPVESVGIITRVNLCFVCDIYEYSIVLHVLKIICCVLIDLSCNKRACKMYDYKLGRLS